MTTPRSHSCDFLTPRSQITPRSQVNSDVFNTDVSELLITPRLAITPRRATMTSISRQPTLSATPRGNERHLKKHNSDIISNNPQLTSTVIIEKYDPRQNIPRYKKLKQLLLNHPFVIVP